MASNRTPFHQTPEYVKGDTSQRLVAEFIMRRGWYVNPTYDYTAQETKAPRMQGPTESLVLPDLDVARRTVRRWVEVKYKTTAAWYRKRRRLQHGLETHHLHHYLRVEAETGCELWLAIHEGITGKLLVRRAEDLLRHVQDWDGWTDGARPRYEHAMTYFPRDQFQHLTTIPYPDAHPEFDWLRKVFSYEPEAVRRYVDRRLACLDADESLLLRREQSLLDRHLWAAKTLLETNDLLPWFDVP